MGAIKTFEYTPEEWDISIIARGISHPARVRIIRHLKTVPAYRNVDFCKLLRMRESSVKDHLDKLHDASLISVTYLPHYYAVSLNKARVEQLEHLMSLEI
jgi:hypothetical protein